MPLHERRMARTFVDPREYEGRNISIELWTDPPCMCAGAPCPTLAQDGDKLFVAYYRSGLEDPGFEAGLDALPPVAVLQFNNVREYYMDAPNDEALHLHPLYS